MAGSQTPEPAPAPAPVMAPPAPVTGGAEHGISALLVVLIYMYGWIKSYEVTTRFRVRDVIEGTPYRLFSICFQILFPYLEVWMIIVVGIMMLFAVDKILVTIMSMSYVGVTIADSYATMILLSCFRQWQIIGGIAMSMMVVIGLTFTFMFWIRLQHTPSEQLLSRGLSTINIFGMVLALNIVIIQSFITKP